MRKGKLWSLRERTVIFWSWLVWNRSLLVWSAVIHQETAPSVTSVLLVRWQLKTYLYYLVCWPILALFYVHLEKVSCVWRVHMVLTIIHMHCTILLITKHWFDLKSSSKFVAVFWGYSVLSVVGICWLDNDIDTILLEWSMISKLTEPMDVTLLFQLSFCRASVWICWSSERHRSTGTQHRRDGLPGQPWICSCEL